MKKAFFLAILLAPLFVFAQSNKFNIKGKLGSYSAPAKAYFWYQVNGKTRIDSAVMKNGEFEFTGKVNSEIPVNAHLLFHAKGLGQAMAQDHHAFYLEPGNIKVTGDSTMAKAAITGTKANDDNTVYQKALRSAGILNGPSYEATGPQELDIDKEFISANPGSFISLVILEANMISAVEAARIEPLLNSLSPALRQTKMGKALAAQIAQTKAITIGNIAPDFTQDDANGLPVKLSSFRGKYVLIDFWASWCGPCRQENPNVVKLYNKFKDKGFTVLGISIDVPKNKAAWLAAIKSDGLTWTQVLDAMDPAKSSMVLYGIQAIPQNFLIDPQGKIIGKNLRGNDLDEKLTELVSLSH